MEDTLPQLASRQEAAGRIWVVSAVATRRGLSRQTAPPAQRRTVKPALKRAREALNSRSDFQEPRSLVPIAFKLAIVLLAVDLNCEQRLE
jgi:hypothetical protein